MAARIEQKKAGIPAWLVSFGDMMTLILTFFILLVSMAHERNYGLMADGLGSFIVALKSHGLPGIMSESERVDLFNHVRRRFNLPPEADPERRDAHEHASDMELVRARLAEGLLPHDELFQPLVATFAPGSAELSEAARAYLDRLAETLRPARRQVLVLEGHAPHPRPGAPADDRWMAFERARAVRQWLVERHGFPPERVEARAWLNEVADAGDVVQGVDARLLTPAQNSK